MNTRIRLTTSAMAGLVFAGVATSAPADGQTTHPPLAQEPAGQSLMPTAAGGPRPQNPDVLVLRFLGVANYELAYRDNVILLDAGIDTLSWWEPSGVTPEMMTRDVDAILIGHAHGEHLWDAPFIAEKTGALVVADPIAMRWIRGTGRVADARMSAVKGLGGETFKFNGLTVETVLGHHNIVPDDYMRKDRAAAAAVTLRGGLTTVTAIACSTCPWARLDWRFVRSSRKRRPSRRSFARPCASPPQRASSTWGTDAPLSHVLFTFQFPLHASGCGCSAVTT